MGYIPQEVLSLLLCLSETKLILWSIAEANNEAINGLHGVIPNVSVIIHVYSSWKLYFFTFTLFYFHSQNINLYRLLNF